MVLWRPTRPFRTNTQKRCPFHYRGLECKSRKSRKTWSNRQIWPWSIEWSRAKANRLVQRECTGHRKHLLPTTREKTTWLSPDGQYQNQIDYIICSQRWRNSIQSAERRLGADWGSYHEHLIAKFRLKLKKIGKTIQVWPEKEMATQCSIIAWKIPWTEEPGGLWSMGSQRVRHDWATFLSFSFPMT